MAAVQLDLGAACLPGPEAARRRALVEECRRGLAVECLPDQKADYQRGPAEVCRPDLVVVYLPAPVAVCRLDLVVVFPRDQEAACLRGQPHT